MKVGSRPNKYTHSSASSSWGPFLFDPLKVRLVLFAKVLCADTPAPPCLHSSTFFPSPLSLSTFSSRKKFLAFYTQTHTFDFYLTFKKRNLGLERRASVFTLLVWNNTRTVFTSDYFLRKSKRIYIYIGSFVSILLVGNKSMKLKVHSRRKIKKAAFKLFDPDITTTRT